MSEPDVSNLLSVVEAIEIIDAAPVTPRVVTKPLRDAMGLRLARDLAADRDQPPFDKSLMDGFAVRCADVAGRVGPVELDVVGTIGAGQSHKSPLNAGQAVAIMTGAPLPPGADGIVPVEDTSRPSGRRVRIARAEAISPGRFIARRGSDCAAGATVLPRGTKLEAAALAVTASVGAANVEVFDRPRVTVITTGDEIVPVDATPGDEQIRNVSSSMLTALLKRFECEVTDLGIVRDDPRAIREALQSSINDFDVTFVTGGMSMGEFDYVPRVLIEIGVELKITKLRIKPGKPFVFGVTKTPVAARPDPDSTARSRFVFGLPGNPVSAFTCTARLARRLIARLSGAQPSDAERWITASLSESLSTNGPREFYQPAILDGRGNVNPLPWKGSADIYTLARANALLVRGENEAAQSIGSVVRVLEIPS